MQNERKQRPKEADILANEMMCVRVRCAHHERRRPNPPAQFPKGDHRPGEGDGANPHAERDLDEVHQLVVRVAEVVGESDERGREADERVQQGH